MSVSYSTGLLFPIYSFLIYSLVDEAKKPKKVAGSEKKSTKTRKKDEKKKETALTKVYK